MMVVITIIAFTAWIMVMLLLGRSVFNVFTVVKSLIGWIAVTGSNAVKDPEEH